jgi:uncharacterized protein
MPYDPIVSEIRCPVHGFIGLTDLERTIIDHPAFQRLRRIKQLAWTDYVYPGASHSRFEHSLGVMYVASKLFEAVVESSRSVLTETFGYTNGGLSRDWQIVRLAALLHDIGHAPFSHATEHLLPMKAPERYSLFPGEGKPAEQFAHEDYSVAIIESILADVIHQHPLNQRNAKITAQEVTALIAKRAPAGASLFWKDVISGQLDADRMDYLLRDSLHAGVSYGKFDLNRIVSSVCAIRRPSEESNEPKIALMRGGGYAAEALIVARYWMHKQVYFHKTRLACNHHLEEAVRSILNNGKSVEVQGTLYPRPDSVDQLNEFLKWDDYRVMGHLVAGEGGEHGRRLMTRNHYRLVCELTESDATPQQLADSAERNKAIVAALQPYVKHVTQPKSTWYKSKANDLVLVEDSTKEQIGFLSNYSALLGSINYGSSQFVYADRPDIPAAKKIYRDFLIAESQKDLAQETKAEEERQPDTQIEADSTQVQSEFQLDDSKLLIRPVQRQNSPQPQKGIQNAG